MKKSVPMKTRKKIAVFVAGGALLCAGVGVTGALYHAEQNNAPAKVVAGSLSVTNGTPGSWYDGKTGQAVDPASFGMTPSDTLVKAAPITIDVTGANAAATLTADMPSLTGDLASDANGLYGTVELVKGTYDPASHTELDPSKVVASTLLGGQTQHRGTNVDFAQGSGSGPYTVVTTLQVSSGTKATASTALSAVLDQVQFQLNQVRPVDPAVTPWIIPDPAFKAVVIQDLTDADPSFDPATPLTLAIARNMQWIGGDMTGVKDITGAEQAINVTDVNLANASGLTSIEPLAGLVKVNSFQIDSAYGVSDFSPMSGKPNLTSYSDNGSSVGPGTKFLASDRALQSVTLQGDTHLTGIDGLSDLKHLSFVNIAGTMVTDPSPLNGLKGATVYVTAGGLSDPPVVDWSGSAPLLANNNVSGDNIPTP